MSYASKAVGYSARRAHAQVLGYPVWAKMGGGSTICQRVWQHGSQVRKPGNSGAMAAGLVLGSAVLPFCIQHSAFCIRSRVALLALCESLVGALGSHWGGFVGALGWL